MDKEANQADCKSKGVEDEDLRTQDKRPDELVVLWHFLSVGSNLLVSMCRLITIVYLMRSNITWETGCEGTTPGQDLLPS